MTRHLALVALMAMFVSTPLSAAAPAAATRSDAVVQRNNRRYEIELQRQIDDVKARITRLNAENKELVSRLEAIAAQAKKEEATETAQQVQQLIEQVNRNHTAELKDLERKLGRFNQVVQKISRKERLERNVGTRARGFTLKNAQGKDVSLNEHRGKIIVLEWINPECPYTRYYYERKIIPSLVKRYQDKGVVWLSINSGQDASVKANEAFAKRHGLTHDVLSDAAGMVARTFGARKTPHVFIIDRKGVIAYNGAIDDSPATGGKQKQVNRYVEKALAQLVADKPVREPYSEPIGTPLGRTP